MYDTANDQSTTVHALIPDCSDRSIVLTGVNRVGELEYLSFTYDSAGNILGNGWENHVITPEDLFSKSTNGIVTKSTNYELAEYLSSNLVGTKALFKVSNGIPFMSL